MSHPTNPSEPERGELHTQLFANIVMQQAGMTMIFLGVTPHPETGETMFDLEGAQHFIAQLEMLEAKTKGNLSADETALLKQSLISVRMAFVQAAQRGAPARASKKPIPAPDSVPAPAVEAGNAAGPQPTSEEERKKFVKKY